MSKYKAFIDNGQIKIVQFDGLEYVPAIAKQEKKVKFIKNGVKACVAGLVIFVLTAFSPLFFSFITGWQIVFFILCAIACAIGTAIFAGEVSGNETYCDNLVQEYNLAKEILQPEIMELQKKLIKHNSELQQLEAQSKFSFKKPAIQEITA